MKGVVLAGGSGSRLKPLTAVTNMDEGRREPIDAIRHEDDPDTIFRMVV